MDRDQGSWTEIGELVGLIVRVVLIVSQNVSPNHQEGAASNAPLAITKHLCYCNRETCKQLLSHMIRYSTT